MHAKRLRYKIPGFFSSLLVGSTATRWKKDSLNELLNGRVIFTGYSARDYTALVPIDEIANERRATGSPQADYYFLQESDLSVQAQNITHDDGTRHIKLDADDALASVYFEWIRTRLFHALTYARGIPPATRPFREWHDESWQTAMARVDRLLRADYPSTLDYVLGDAGHRQWGEEAWSLPVRLSTALWLFCRGDLETADRYRPLPLDPLRDAVMLILIAALADALKDENDFRLSIGEGSCGLRLANVRQGSNRQILLYHGPYENTAYYTLSMYLNRLEEKRGALPSPEVVIIPCNTYTVPGGGLTPGRQIIERQLPGMMKATRNFVDPRDVFDTGSYEELVGRIARTLDL